jgi:hypothetical protein
LKKKNQDYYLLGLCDFFEKKLFLEMGFLTVKHLHHADTR